MIETVNDPICSYYKLAGKAAKLLVSNQQAAKAQGWLELSMEMYRTISSMSTRAERESLT